MPRFFPVQTIALFTLLLSLAGCEAVQDELVRWVAKDNDNHALLKDQQNIHVFLCGTGTPQIRSPRGQACTAVIAGGQVFVFDAGENALRNLETSHIPVAAIDKVFITHWHSDHFNGLGGLINHSWANGRQQPLTVFGPEGVEQVVQGYAQIYARDIGYRSKHFQPLPELAVARAHPIVIPTGQESITVYEQDGVRIDAYLVAHQPVEPAFGYVLTYHGKKVFVSGDTRVSKIYLPAMQDADLVVHEAINSALTRRAARVLREDGRLRDALPAEHVTDYHADTLELAAMAQQARVKQLVLTHLIPAPTNFISEWMFKRGMEDIYHGELTLGEDGMHIVLPAP